MSNFARKTILLFSFKSKPPDSQSSKVEKRSFISADQWPAQATYRKPPNDNLSFPHSNWPPPFSNSGSRHQHSFEKNVRQVWRHVSLFRCTLGLASNKYKCCRASLVCERFLQKKVICTMSTGQAVLCFCFLLTLDSRFVINLLLLLRPPWFFIKDSIVCTDINEKKAIHN